MEVKLSYSKFVKPVFKLVWQSGRIFFFSLLVLALLNGLVPVAFIALNATLVETLVQAINSTAGVEELIVVLAWLGGLTFLAHLLEQAQLALRELYQIHISNHLQEQIAAKASTLDLSFFENPSFHDQISQASNEASFRSIDIVQNIVLLVSLAVNLILIAGVLLLWQWWIVSIILIFASIMFVLQAKFGRAQVRLFVKMTPNQRLAAYINTLLTADWATKEIRLFNLGPHLLKRLHHQHSLLYKAQQGLTRRQFIAVGVLGAILVLYPYLLIGFTAFQVIGGLLTIGQFSLYSQSIQQMHSTLHQFMNTMARLHESHLFVTHLFDFISLKPDVEAPRSESTLALKNISSAPHVEFRNVSFIYPNTSKTVASNISFELNPGESVALVGNNGAGKTTIIKLLTGLYRPTTGKILLDGVDIETLNREDLRNFFSVILQDYTIYHLSTYDNIAFGQVEEIENRNRIEAAAELSGLDRIVDQLPDKYHTILGRFFERGHELSGGQKQLIALTRALMRQAPILILDEPSAALDTYMEKHFFKTLLQKFKAKRQSAIFISHRFSSVRQADKILVLKQGQIIEQGSHKQLMSMEGYYADMFATQVEMYDIRS